LTLFVLVAHYIYHVIGKLQPAPSPSFSFMTQAGKQKNPSKYCRQQPRALRPLAFPTVRLPARVDRSRPLDSYLAENFYPTCAFSMPQSLICGAIVERVPLVSEGIRLAPCVYEIGRRETRWRRTWFRLLPEGKIVNSHIILFPLLWRGRAWRRPCRRQVRRSRLPGRGGPWAGRRR
jgi:hypothetical protein